MSAAGNFPALADMMGHCFHQDMDLEAETVPEAVAMYARGLPGAAKRALQADIDRFRGQHPDNLDGAFLRAFGDDLDPREVGFGVADFLRMVEAVVEDPASFRAYLDADLRPAFPHLRRCARACRDLLCVTAEARRLGRTGADSVAHALSIHLGALPGADTRALLAELQQFDELYGGRASHVFGKRWLDLETRGFDGFRAFRQAAEQAAGVVDAVSSREDRDPDGLKPPAGSVEAQRR